jgi:hypothetical protein
VSAPVKITNSKLQISNKFQRPKYKIPNRTPPGLITASISLAIIYHKKISILKHTKIQQLEFVNIAGFGHWLFGFGIYLLFGA